MFLEDIKDLEKSMDLNENIAGQLDLRRKELSFYHTVEDREISGEFKKRINRKMSQRDTRFYNSFFKLQSIGQPKQ